MLLHSAHQLLMFHYVENGTYIKTEFYKQQDLFEVCQDYKIFLLHLSKNDSKAF